jgi:hypothetical protein
MNYKDALVKTKKRKMASCWIDQEGNWYNCEFGKHNSFAFHVLEEIGSQEEKEHWSDTIEHAAQILLHKYKWIFVHDDAFNGVIVNGAKHMSEKQYKVLLDYFGNALLFRGWTIRLLWENRSERDD